MTVKTKKGLCTKAATLHLIEITIRRAHPTRSAISSRRVFTYPWYVGHHWLPAYLACHIFSPVSNVLIVTVLPYYCAPSMKRKARYLKNLGCTACFFESKFVHYVASNVSFYEITRHSGQSA